jgi:hypothetical protein
VSAGIIMKNELRVGNDALAHLFAESFNIMLRKLLALAELFDPGIDKILLHAWW